MKKKILAFFFALHIFCFSLVYCFCCPVYAVGEGAILFEGFQTLMLMLGVSADLSGGLSQTQWVTKVDEEFSNAIAKKNQEQQDILLDNYATFKDNLQHGYMIITDTLFNFFKDTTYDDFLVSSISYSSLNATQKAFISNNSNRYDKTYFILVSPVDGPSSSYNCYNMYCINYTVPSSITFVNPPTFTYVDSVSQTMRRYTLATMTSSFPSYGIFYATYNNSDNALRQSGVLSDFQIQCVNRWTRTELKPFSCMFLGSLDNIDFIDNLTDVSKTDYNDIIDDTFVNSDGYITTTDGIYPQVLDDTTVGDIVDDVKSGQKSWASAIGSITDSYPENPAMPEDTLTLPELDQLIADLHLERLESKFPFCIPHDIQLIYSGATAVSANAPVLVIPIDITFKEHTYFHDDEFITIDFSMFDSIIPIFREGFFLLFLVGLLWVSIHILQAFFVVTE